MSKAVACYLFKLCQIPRLTGNLAAARTLDAITAIHGVLVSQIDEVVELRPHARIYRGKNRPETLDLLYTIPCWLVDTAHNLTCMELRCLYRNQYTSGRV